MKDDVKKNYLVYQITNKINNKIYIGCHITEKIDDGYMGSGSNIKKALKEFGKENFDKIILYNFDNKDDMLKKEEQLVNREFIARDDTYNIIIGGGQFLTIDTVMVKDINGNCLRVHKNDPRYLSGELISVSKNMVSVKDENGNTFSVNINDPRYISGELVSINKDMILVIDKNNPSGVRFFISRDDPRYISGELVGYRYDNILAKDKNNNYILIDKNDPRYLNGDLVGLTKGNKISEEHKRKIGEANSLNRGVKNSQYGTCWIHNLELKQNKKISKLDLEIWENNGWLKGRKMKF